MATINQKPSKDIQRTKRKEPKQNTKEKQQTTGKRSRREERKRGELQKQLKNN